MILFMPLLFFITIFVADKFQKFFVPIKKPPAATDGSGRGTNAFKSLFYLRDYGMEHGTPRSIFSCAVFYAYVKIGGFSAVVGVEVDNVLLPFCGKYNR
jgi:hypothetical protein